MRFGSNVSFSFTLTKDTIFPMGGMRECAVKLAALLHTLGGKFRQDFLNSSGAFDSVLFARILK